MTAAFTQKTIRAEITLHEGDFADGYSQTVIEGLPISVKVTKPGTPELASATIGIAGLNMDKLEKLTTLNFLPMEHQKNLITIKVGDLGQELSLVFAGEISSAWAKFSTDAKVELQIEAMSGFYPKRIPAKPLSINGSAQVADLIAQQAAEAGYNFINQGVTASVKNAVFNGSPIDKAKAIARQVGVELLIDDNTLILYAAGEYRAGEPVLIAPETGMLGYPTFNNDGIKVECLYRPEIQQGGLIEIRSIVPKASAFWEVTKLSHSLQVYGGGDDWKSEIEAKYVDKNS